MVEGFVVEDHGCHVPTHQQRNRNQSRLGSKGIIFGQQDAALMGCEDLAGERWTLGKYWNRVMQEWLLDPALGTPGIRSDLAYATIPQPLHRGETLHPGAVSYTHLTLPTICSV